MNSPEEQHVADALGVPGASVTFGPGCQSVQKVKGTDQWRWLAAGPRGVKEGVANSYEEAWDATRGADVSRRALTEDATMPDFLPLWRKYPEERE